MQFLILPATNRPATHKAADGTLVAIKEVADGVKVGGATPVNTINGYVPLTTAEAAKATALAAALAKYTAQIKAGVTVGAITLAATPDDQNNFSNLVTHLANEDGPTTATVKIIDLSGTLHELTVEQFRKLMVAYGKAVYSAWSDYQHRVAEIKSA